MKKLYITLGVSLLSTISFGQRHDAEALELTKAEHLRVAPIQKEMAEQESQFDILFDRVMRGDAEATYEMGMVYLSGNHVKRDFDRAYKLLERAVQMGYAKAWVEIGNLYKFGLGREMDYSKAYECFSKGAVLDVPEALSLKGYMQYKGLGIQQDYKAAIESFSKGLELGSTSCTYMMGICYRNGFGVEKNEIKAQELLTKASEQGHYSATAELLSDSPEHNPNAVEMLERVEAAKKIGAKIDYPINEFTRIDNKANQEDINGVFEGFLLKYDWSEEVVIGATPVILDLKLKDGNISGIWSEKGREDKVPINGTVENNRIVFKEMKFKMVDHYHQENPLVYTFLSADLKYLNKGDDIFIAGNIDFYVPSLREPHHPHSLVLEKQHAVTPAEAGKTIMALSVYPNPFDSETNIEFTLKVAGETGLRLTSLNGQLMYSVPKKYLESGNYVFPMKLDIPSGIYFVTIESNGENCKSKIIKR